MGQPAVVACLISQVSMVVSVKVAGAVLILTCFEEPPVTGPMPYSEVAAVQ